MLPISSDEDLYVPSCVRVPARGLPPPLGFRCFGFLSGSLSGLPPQEGPSAPRYTAGFSLAPQTIAPPAVTPPLLRQVQGQRLNGCAPGTR